MFYAHAAACSRRTRRRRLRLRRIAEFTNLLINELPRGDFAFTMTRQFLIDAFNVPYLTALTASTDSGIAGIAAKAVKESQYHLRRSRDWMLRLGDGTAESHTRAHALDALWGYTHELFEPAAGEAAPRPRGACSGPAAMKVRWRENRPDIERATLERLADTWQVGGGRAGVHTEHLGHLLAEMQFMQRAYPGQQWYGAAYRSSWPLSMQADSRCAASPTRRYGRYSMPVMDPEIPVCLWDLGVLQDVRRRRSIVVVMTPTYVGCPAWMQ